MPKYLDLFAGAGGLSEGFIQAGYDPVAHVEMDEAACFTLKTRAAYHWLKEITNWVCIANILEEKYPEKKYMRLFQKMYLIW